MATSEKRGASVVSRGKTLLRNVIRHTDWHNRMLEEAEMWNQHAKAKKGVSNETETDGRIGRREKYECRSKNIRRNEPFKDNSDMQKSFLYDDREPVSSTSYNNNHLRRQPMHSAHMDVGHGDRVDGKTGTNNGGDSTFWMRQLYKAEEGDEDRWGHAGFKELYPQVFQPHRADSSGKSSEDSSSSSSSSSEDDSDDEPKSRSSSRKRKKRKMMSAASRETSSSRKKKKKKKDEKIRRKDKEREDGGKEKKRGKDDSGRGGSYSSDEDEEDEKRRTRRDSSRRIKRKRRRRKDGGSSSSDDEEERKKKSKRKSAAKERERKSKKRKKKLKD